MTDVEQDCLEETLPSQHDACTPPPSAFHDDSRESTDDEAVFEALASQFRSSRAPATPLRSSEEEEHALERSISGLSLARPPRSPSPVMSEPRVHTPAKSERNTPVRTAYNRPLSTLDDDVSKKLFDDKENVPPNKQSVRALDEWRSAEDEDGDTYYYNRRTRRVAWELPRGAVTVERDGVSRIVAPRDRTIERSVDIERCTQAAQQAASMAQRARAVPRTPPRTASPFPDLAAALREATTSTPERVFSPACKVAPATPPPSTPERPRPPPPQEAAPAVRTPVREEPQARAAPPSPMPVRTPPQPEPKKDLQSLRARLAARAQRPPPQEETPQPVRKPSTAVTPHDLPKPRRLGTPRRTPLSEANFGESPPPQQPRVFCCYCGQPSHVSKLNAHLASCPQRKALATTPVERRLRQALRNHWAASPQKPAKKATTPVPHYALVSPE